MAFERAKIVVNSPSVGTGIKVTLRQGRSGQASMIFSIKGEIAKGFNWSDGDKIEVLIGTGSDHGLLRFRKNNSTGDAVVKSKKAMKGITYTTISLGHQPAFVNRAEAGRWCQFEQVDDGFVEIVLPRWAEETSPKKQAVAVSPVSVSGTAPIPQGRVAQPTPSPVKRAVTAQVLGDPPPGRREMLAKMGEMKV